LFENQLKIRTPEDFSGHAGQIPYNRAEVGERGAEGCQLFAAAREDSILRDQQASAESLFRYAVQGPAPTAAIASPCGCQACLK